MRTKLLTIAATFLMVGASPGQVTRAYPVVALQGAATPSISPTATYGGLGGEPRIGQGGHVVFGGFVGNNGSNDYAIWTGQPGAIAKLAVRNDPAPGRIGGLLDVFYKNTSAPYWVCPDGTVAFESRVSTVNDDGIWMGTPGNLQEVAIVNNPVPGIAGATFKGFPGIVFQANGQGHLALRAYMQGTGITTNNDSGVWIGKVGDMALIAREGTQAANLGPTVVFNDLNNISFSLNAHGQLCLIAGVSTRSLTQNTSLFLGDRNGLTRILEQGNPIVGFSPLSWNTFGKPRLNNHGTVLLETTPTTGGQRSFFTRKSNGTVTRLAEETAEPPGSAGQSWAGFFFSNPALGGNDFAVLGTGLNPGWTNSAKDGIWIASGNVTRLVSRKGDVAQGLAGQTFNDYAPGLQGPAVNSSGTVVFQATTNTGVNGIWFWRNEDLRLLLAPGDFIKISPGDTREVTSFSVKLGSGGQSGVPSGLNDRGQLVVKVGFKFGTTAIILINNILDQDGDGLDSLLEEAFGGSPNNPSDAVSQQSRLQRTGTTLKLLFPRRTDGSFQYVVETSEVLGGWSDLTATPVLSADQSGLLPGTERVEVPIPSGEDRLFTRVRAMKVSP
ncbi:MAG: choice-of-anchor tandem repeat NxxGxxAF-containing protein [Verrucomicrobiales bacterium]